MYSRPNNNQQKKPFYSSTPYLCIKELIGISEPFFFSSLVYSKSIILDSPFWTTSTFGAVGVYLFLNDLENLLNRYEEGKGHNKTLFNLYRWSSIPTLLMVTAACTISIGEKLGSSALTSIAAIKIGSAALAPALFLAALFIMAARELAYAIYWSNQWKKAENSDDISVYRWKACKHTVNFSSSLFAMIVVVGLFSIFPVNASLLTVSTIMTTALMLLSRIMKYVDLPTKISQCASSSFFQKSTNVDNESYLALNDTSSINDNTNTNTNLKPV